MLDVLLAVISALIAIAMGFLGFYVSIHPQTALQSQKKLKLTFLLLGFLGVTLVGILAYRAHNAQRELKEEIAESKNEISEIREDNRKAQETINNLLSTITAAAAKLPAHVPIDEKNIRVGIQYAYEWEGYKGSTNAPRNTWREIDEPLQKKFSQEEMRLLFFVGNFHETQSIRNVYLHVFFEGAGVNIRADPNWGVMIPGKHYFELVGDIINPKQLLHPGNLFIKFSKASNYKVSYVINGDGFKAI